MNDDKKGLGDPGAEPPVALSAVSPSQEPREDAAPIANAPPHKARRSLLPLLLAPALLAGEMPDMGGTRGLHRGENRRPKQPDNSPDRAPGMKPFDIDGVIVYAGTLKAACKLARRLRASALVSAAEVRPSSDDRAAARGEANGGVITATPNT